MAAMLPEDMEPDTLETMSTGERVYTLPWGMWVDADRLCWLHPGYPADAAPHGTACMAVELREDGYHVWPPADQKYKPAAAHGYVSPDDTPWIPVAELHR